MVLAVAKLEQAVGVHLPISATRRRVDAYLFRLQGVDTQQAPIQALLKGIPLLIVTQGLQDDGQAIIAEVQRPHRVFHTSAQRFLASFYPWLHVTQAVIRFSEDVRQPTCHHPAQAQPLPVSVHVIHLIQQLRNSHALLMGQQQRRVIHSFCRYGKLFSHTESLPQLSKPVEFLAN